MSKKKRTRKTRELSARSEARSGSGRKGLLSTPSLIFIGLIVLIGLVAFVSSRMGESVECPPGLVWSDEHVHCH